MGVAKAALEASVRCWRPTSAATASGQCHLGWADQDLAASGIADFRYILRWNEYNSALRRTVTIEEVGASALYLLSDLSAASPAFTMSMPATACRA
jgi:enoyl-[acyl-carrier protein] reductase I